MREFKKAAITIHRLLWWSGPRRASSYFNNSHRQSSNSHPIIEERQLWREGGPFRPSAALFRRPLKLKHQPGRSKRWDKWYLQIDGSTANSEDWARRHAQPKALNTGNVVAHVKLLAIILTFNLYNIFLKKNCHTFTMTNITN